MLHRQAVQVQLALLRDFAKPRAAEEKLTPEQEAAETAKYVKARQAEAGESPFKSMRQEITEARGERAKNLDRAQGVALLEAAREALQPGGTMRGLAGAAAAFGGSYGRALQADRAERRSLANMEMNIADAERKERMGLYGEARALRTAAAKERRDADRFEQDRRANLVRLASGIERGLRPPTSGAGAGRPPSLPQVDRRIGQLQEELIDRSQKNPDDPQIPVIQQKIASLTKTLEASKTTESGPGRLGAAEAELNRKIDEAVAADVSKFGRMPSHSPVYKDELRAAKTALSQAQQTNDPKLIAQRQAEVNAVLKKYETDRREYHRRNASLLMQSAPAAGAAIPAPPANYVIDKAPR